MKSFLLSIFMFFIMTLGNNHGFVCPDGDGGDGGDKGDGDKGDGDKGDPEPSKKEGDPDGDPEPRKTDDDPDGQKLEDLPAWAQKQIKDLRSESANHRTKNNTLTDRFNKMEAGIKKAFGMEDDDSTPEEKLEQAQSDIESSSLQNAVLTLAIENNIGKDGIEFLTFLIEKAVSTLEENEEISDESLEAIIKKAKAQGPASANSSVDGDGDGGGSPPSPKGSNDITLEQFTKMNVIEQSILRRDHKEVYERLRAQNKNR